MHRCDAPLLSVDHAGSDRKEYMSTLELRLRSFLIGVAVFAFGTGSLVGSVQAQEVLKIGVLGVMSGPAASWGLVNKYCAETSAQLYNEQGGVEIGGKKLPASAFFSPSCHRIRLCKGRGNRLRAPMARLPDAAAGTTTTMPWAPSTGSAAE